MIKGNYLEQWLSNLPGTVTSRSSETCPPSYNLFPNFVSISKFLATTAIEVSGA